MNRILRGLHDHWFEPAPVRDLAIARLVLLGTWVFLFVRGTIVNLLAGTLPPGLEMQRWTAQLPGADYDPLPALDVLMAPWGWGARPGPVLVEVVWWLCVVAGIMAFVGLLTRTSLIVFAATYAFRVAHEYSFGEFHHPQAAFLIAVSLLALAPSGERLSVDAAIRRIRRSLKAGERPEGAPDRETWQATWPLRAIQWILVLMYLSSGLFKLQAGGLGWFNGYTLSYYMTLDGFTGGGPTAILMAQSIPLMIASSIVAVGFELTFALGVLIPALTLPYVVLGLGFHAANWVFLDAPFPLVMAMYGAFLPALARGPAVARVMSLIAPRVRAVAVGGGPSEASRGWSLVYDGLCPLCIRTTIILSSLELRSRLRFVDFEADWDRAAELVPGLTPADARHAWALVGPRGQVYRGFFAFRALTRILPPLWVVAPLAHLPGSGLVGPRVYSWVAARRARRSCDSGTCAPTPAVR